MESTKLPSMEKTFYISVRGKETGRMYEGEFTYVRPNLHKKAEIAKMNVRLNGDLKNLPLDVHVFNNMSSTLYHCVTNAPKWWEESNFGRDLYDVEVIEAIWKETEKFEDEWYEQVFGEKKKDLMGDVVS